MIAAHVLTSTSDLDGSWQFIATASAAAGLLLAPPFTTRLEQAATY
jgi:hypothetical protein